MPFATVNGISIHYKLYGEGTTDVVLVNGLADDLETWAYQVSDLVEAGYRVLAIDNRGIGKSDQPPGPYTTLQMAEDIYALTVKLDMRTFHMFGLSMGGMIAQEYALHHPETLISLVLGATYAEPGPFCSRMFAMWADMATTVGVSFIMRDVMLWAFTLDFFETRPEEVHEFESAMADLQQPVDAYLAQLSSIQTHNTTSRLGTLTVPTMVLAGEQDILIPVELSRRLFEHIPHAKWSTTPGGHAYVWEYPKECNAKLIAFLGEHS